MLIGLKGLVLKVIPKTDSDRLIVLFTVERGKIAVCAKGSRSAKNKLLPCIEPFAYSEFVLYEKDGFFWIKEASLIENFYKLREDVVKLALASYLCEVLDMAVYENMEEPELLRLGLNSLYALSADLRPPQTVKAVFEMRASLLLGFAPDVSRCAKCGKAHAKSYCFSLIDGETVCTDCREKALKDYYATLKSVNAEEERRYASQIYLISEAVREAIRFLVGCAPDKMYAFTMPQSEMDAFAKLCEDHLCYRLERKPKTLNFYHEVSAL